LARRRPARKVVDESIYLGRPRRGSILKEEVWVSHEGEVVKYSLAYLIPAVCAVDNGRILGYDNHHGGHHRHFQGAVEPIEFAGYPALATQFQEEVWELWRREDEERESETA
jgi:hypothetical protein